MKIKNKTLQELKEFCKKNNFKNYSKLDKINLIKLIKKNMKGGISFNGILNRESLLMLLGRSEEVLINLTELHLRSKNIKHIDKNTFNGLSNLTVLDLGENQITEIDKTTFNELSNLTELDLSFNKITKIDETTFNGLSNLTKIVLSYNKHLILEKGAFDGLISLEDFLINKKFNKKSPTVENIRSYNKYYYLYQKIDNIDKNVNIVQNKIQISDAFYKKLKLIYTLLRDKTYIDDFNNKLRKTNEEYNKNLWGNNKERVVKNNNNNINKIKLRNDTETNNNIPIKKYLIQKSQVINVMLSNNMLSNNNNNLIEIPSKIINKNSDIELMRKYLEDKNLDNFNNTQLLILFKIFDYLDIRDKKDMSSLFEKIFENIKDFNEEEIIQLFGFKKKN